MGTIVYTAIFGKYDTLREIQTSHRTICFTDQDISSTSWEIRKLEFRPKIFREIKICPHLFLPKHDRSIWMDGNISSADIDDFVKSKSGLWVMKHPQRDCIYQEAVKCLDLKKCDIDNILPQINKYRREGYPINNGLAATGVLVRDNTELLRKFSQVWWNEVSAYSLRDQLSFDYAAWKLKIKYNTFPYLETFSTQRHVLRVP